jgi:hypothetical protein
LKEKGPKDSREQVVRRLHDWASDTPLPTDAEELDQKLREEGFDPDALSVKFASFMSGLRNEPAPSGEERRKRALVTLHRLRERLDELKKSFHRPLPELDFKGLYILADREAQLSFRGLQGHPEEDIRQIQMDLEALESLLLEDGDEQP